MSAIGKAARRAIALPPPATNTWAGRLRPYSTTIPRSWSGGTVSHSRKSSLGYSGKGRGADPSAAPAEPIDQSYGLAAVQRWRGNGGNSSKGRRRFPAASESKQPSAHGVSALPQALGAEDSGHAGVGQVDKWTVGDKRATGVGFDDGSLWRRRGVEGRARPWGDWGGGPKARQSRHGAYRDGQGVLSGGDAGGNISATAAAAAAAAAASALGGGVGQACIMRRLKRAKVHRDAEGAKRILEDALAQDDAAEVVDVFVYSAAVGVFAKTGQWEAALGVLGAMKERGVQPNAFTYNQAIAACGNGGAWEWAVYLLKAMPKVGVAPDVVSYNAAIAACGASKQPELAMVLLREMTPGVVPNATTYSAAMSAIVAPSGCANATAAAAAVSTPSWRLAVTLLEEMREAGAAPDAACYRPAVAACAAAGQIDKAIELLRQMHREHGVVPDLESYNAVMAACRRVNKWEQAVLLLSDMKSAEGIRPDSVTYTEVAAACRKGGQPGLAADLSSVIPGTRRA